MTGKRCVMSEVGGVMLPYAFPIRCLTLLRELRTRAGYGDLGPAWRWNAVRRGK